MGTNAYISNMITAGKCSGNIGVIWAYVFYRLPSFPNGLLTKELKKLSLSDFFDTCDEITLQGEATFCQHCH